MSDYLQITLAESEWQYLHDLVYGTDGLIDSYERDPFKAGLGVEAYTFLFEKLQAQEAYLEDKNEFYGTYLRYLRIGVMRIGVRVRLFAAAALPSTIE